MLWYVLKVQRQLLYSICLLQGRHEWGKVGDRSNSKTCPICLSNSATAKLFMGIEPAFYVDSGEPDYCFVPCGHMANSKTVRYWSSIPIPCGTSGFQSACPFCATPLLGEGFCKRRPFFRFFNCQNIFLVFYCLPGLFNSITITTVYLQIRQLVGHC